MTPGKDQIVLHASSGFKDALGAYATDNKTSMSEVIRKAVAEMIGYDLSQDPARTRTPKYATPEEAKRVGLYNAGLKRWGNKTASGLLLRGEIEAATTIARAIKDNDYDTLEMLKEVAESENEESENEDE